MQRPRREQNESLARIAQLEEDWSGRTGTAETALMFVTKWPTTECTCWQDEHIPDFTLSQVSVLVRAQGVTLAMMKSKCDPNVMCAETC